MKEDTKVVAVVIAIIVVIVLILVLTVDAGGSDLYRLFRLDGYTAEQAEYYMSLPQVQSLQFDTGDVVIKESCLLIAANFRKVYSFSIDDSCKIVIKKLIDLDKKSEK